MTMEQVNKMMGIYEKTSPLKNNNELYRDKRFKIVDSIKEKRLYIYFYRKVDIETRVKLKNYGFRWNSKKGCWQRFRSGFAIYIAKKILEIEDV